MGLAATNPRTLILSIQYLRAAAALAVAAHHIVNRKAIPLETASAGVDVFFVISGFIMWTVTARRTPSPTPFAFLIDRLSRIVPLYVSISIGTYLLATFVPAVFPNMVTNLHHLILSILFIPHMDPLGTYFPQVVPGWTLNYEMFFYVVFAVGLLLPVGRRPHLYILTLVVLVIMGVMIPDRPILIETYTSPLLLEFGAGVWLGVLWQKSGFPSVAIGWLMLVAGLVAFVLLELLYGQDPGRWRAVVWGLPALAVVFGALTIENGTVVFKSSLLLLLGNASFSIYLVNAFAVAAAWRLFGRLPLPLYVPIGLLVSAGAGVVTWWVIERPVTKITRRLVSHRPPAILAVPTSKSV